MESWGISHLGVSDMFCCILPCLFNEQKFIWFSLSNPECLQKWGGVAWGEPLYIPAQQSKVQVLSWAKFHSALPTTPPNFKQMCEVYPWTSS